MDCREEASLAALIDDTEVGGVRGAEVGRGAIGVDLHAPAGVKCGCESVSAPKGPAKLVLSHGGGCGPPDSLLKSSLAICHLPAGRPPSA